MVALDVDLAEVAIDRARVEDTAPPTDEPALAVPEVLLDALDELVIEAKSAAFHLICTLYAFNPSLIFVKLVEVVLVPAPSVTTILIGPSETAVPIANAQP